MPRTIGNPHGWPDYTWPMVWVLQDAELWPIEQWVAHQGQHKLWYIAVSVPGSGYGYVDVYTVPAGKKLYLIRYWASLGGLADHIIYYNPPTVILFDGVIQQNTPMLLPLAPPIVLSAGKTLSVGYTNGSTVPFTAHATLAAFELDV